MKKITSNKGFTLIEIMVVLVILSIMGSIFIPAMSGYIELENQKQAIGECASVVASAQTLIAQREELGLSGDNLIPETSEMLEMAGVDGAVSVDEIKDGRLAHLRFTGDTYTVGYCSMPDSCEKHFSEYTIEKDPVITDPTEAVKNYFGKVNSLYETLSNLGEIKDPAYLNGQPLNFKGQSMDSCMINYDITKYPYVTYLYNSLDSDVQKWLDDKTWKMSTDSFGFRIRFAYGNYNGQSATNVTLYKIKFENGKMYFQKSTTGVITNGKITGDGKWGDWSEIIE